MPSYQLGLNGAFVYSETAVTASDNTTLGTSVSAATTMTNVIDVTGEVTVETDDLTTRANSGWAQTVPTVKKASIKIKALWIPSNANLRALRDAMINSTEIFAAALDKAQASGAQGLAGNWIVSSFSRPEPIKGGMTVDITLESSSFNGWYKNGIS